MLVGLWFTHTLLKIFALSSVGCGRALVAPSVLAGLRLPHSAAGRAYCGLLPHSSAVFAHLRLLFLEPLRVTLRRDPLLFVQLTERV